jgi:hypothetical protein
MSEQLVSSVTTVLLAIVGVAIIAVLVSKNANTTGVIGAGGSAFSQSLATAEGPVTGYTPGGFGGFGAGL